MVVRVSPVCLLFLRFLLTDKTNYMKEHCWHLPFLKLTHTQAQTHRKRKKYDYVHHLKCFFLKDVFVLSTLCFFMTVKKNPLFSYNGKVESESLSLSLSHTHHLSCKGSTVKKNPKKNDNTAPALITVRNNANSVNNNNLTRLWKPTAVSFLPPAGTFKHQFHLHIGLHPTARTVLVTFLTVESSSFHKRTVKAVKLLHAQAQTVKALHLSLYILTCACCCMPGPDKVDEPVWADGSVKGGVCVIGIG